ncbi:DNA polymerase III subunit [Botrimarina hoheduenensis]|uniref:DNA polymerase III subunit tau n=1 Tax=Botrimarina hoheduenensis TaxID=2528000 RepID=A0A5C5WEN5_9BACT|nr:DNA polymerase III subunit [Botrimarina hoheduenensis]TWT48563.1 DNA polymerase III subunit tau [Botrimarina hoheduenensis]
MSSARPEQGAYPAIEAIVGHDEPAERFRQTLRADRLASTYLFVGPEGIGKRSFALALARSLLCQSRSLDDSGPSDPLAACGACDSCRLIDAAGHPDLIEIAKPAGKSTLPLELFIGPPDRRHREGLCHDIALRPSVASRRVAIIDDVDALSVESANALLKTLEEPPPRSLLILVGTSLSRQLPTIRSRAQVVRFRPLSSAGVQQVLETLSSDEAGEPIADVATVAELSRGSVGMALAAAAAGSDGYLAPVVACLESDRFTASRYTSALDEASKSAGTEPSARRGRLREALRITLEHWHGRLRQGDTPAALAALDALLDAEGAIDRNANQPLVADVLAKRLAAAHAKGHRA